MNQNTEFSKLIELTVAIIENGREEAKAKVGSLEKMRLAAIREDRLNEAENISAFLAVASPEIGFFRKAGMISAPIQRNRFVAWIKSFKQSLSPATFSKIDEILTPEAPFSCIEGYMVTTEKSGLDAHNSRLRGPFLLAVAANTSEAVSLDKGNLVCLFSQASKTDKAIELRVWNMNSFCANFGGKSFDQATLDVPPDCNETILKLHRGNPRDLFRIAALKMAKAALSHNPPEKVSEEWVALLKEYAEKHPPLALK